MRFLKQAELSAIVVVVFCSLFMSIDSYAQSSYSCTSDTDCHMGTCSAEQTCVCIQGYVDGPLSPCQFKPTKASYRGEALAEGFTGWIFPTGWAMADMWPIAGIRLAFEAIAGSFIGGFFASRASDRKTQELANIDLGNPQGAVAPINMELSTRSRVLKWLAGISTFFHGVGWVSSTIFFAELEHPDPNFEALLHKDAGEADLVVMASHMASSASVSYEHFEPDSCAIQEGCIDSAGWRRLLRFDSYIYNLGEGDYMAAFENINPVWSGCHQHFHSPEATTYFLKQQLQNGTGNVAAGMRAGHKQGYCFRDTIRISGNYENKFGCGLPKVTKHITQGITSGWADIYGKELDCQWIDITDLWPGTYRLVVTVNPDGAYYQDKPHNNVSIVEVVIPALDENAEKASGGVSVTARVIKEYSDDFPTDMSLLNRIPNSKRSKKK